MFTYPCRVRDLLNGDVRPVLGSVGATLLFLVILWKLKVIILFDLYCWWVADVDGAGHECQDTFA